MFLQNTSDLKVATRERRQGGGRVAEEAAAVEGLEQDLANKYPHLNRLLRSERKSLCVAYAWALANHPRIYSRGNRLRCYCVPLSLLRRPERKMQRSSASTAPTVDPKMIG